MILARTGTLRLALRSLASRPLAALLNILMLGLGIACIIVLLLVGNQLETRMDRDARGIDMVIGAKGSPMQLILAGIYHVDIPPGNISKKSADEIALNPLIKKTIPLALGDSVRGFRIVGAPVDYLALYNATVREGRVWAKPMEVVLGADVARTTGFAVGHTFAGNHGMSEGGEVHAEAPYTVVGILAPSGSVLDRLVLTPVESVWKVHEKEHGIEANSEDAKILAEEREVTLVLVQYASPLAAVMLPRAINGRGDVQAAAPAIELTRLYRIVGVGIEVIQAFALVLVLSAALSVLVALLTALRERRADLAVLRLMGAPRRRLFGLMVVEGALLALAGALLGLLLGHAATAIVGYWLAAQKSVPISGMIWLWQEWGVLAGTVGLGVLASLYPAWLAYRQEVSFSLLER
jgi:putative ABC transport system permease protein